MGAGVHASGKTHRDKGITKQGRRDLRFVMVEAQQAQVAHDVLAPMLAMPEVMDVQVLRRGAARHHAAELVAREYLAAQGSGNVR